MYLNQQTVLEGDTKLCGSHHSNDITCQLSLMHRFQQTLGSLSNSETLHRNSFVTYGAFKVVYQALHADLEGT